MSYLLDTNAFFEVLCEIAEKEIPVGHKYYKLIQNENCYISRITLIEIISVIGKYSRGESGGIQTCTRKIGDQEEICGRKFVEKGRKPWKNRVTGGMIRLVNEIVSGQSELLKLKVVPVTEKILSDAEQFIHNAVHYNFGSMDAIIASTAQNLERFKNEDIVVLTADRSLRAALRVGAIKLHP